MLLSFFHTCASKQHHDLHDRESLILSLSYTSGNFSLQNLACIFQRWASNALGLHDQASWMHTHLVSFERSYTYSSSASVASKSLLTHINIDVHLHSPLIRLVDVRLSPSFLSSPQQPYSIPPIVLCAWPTLMHCVKVEKV